MAAAGDIACDPASSVFNAGAGDATHCRQQATSALLAAGAYAAVLPLGDTQYEDGALSKFQASYDPSWGRVRSLTRPVPGNHEYSTAGAGGYFDYFNGTGSAAGPAGDRTKGYYSYDVPLPSGTSWHIVALNSECAADNAQAAGWLGGCEAGSAQEQWLKADLAAHPTACTLAYWHHPLFSSGGIGNNPLMQQLWRDLYDGGADVVLNGHDHDYERFAPQNPAGAADAAYGMRQLVVGTGGKSLLPTGTLKPNSEVRQNDTFGVLALTLHDSGYDWRFASEAGKTFADSGSGSCHAAPPGGPPGATTGGAGAITTTAATLVGKVNPRSQATSYHFDLGRTTGYTWHTAETSLAATDNIDHAVSARVSVGADSLYHYRLVAKNAAGTTIGADATFRTPKTNTSRYANAVLATPGLLSYWRLGDATGSTAADAKGARPGTYRGRYTLAEPGALAGDVNTSASFDGTNAEATLPGPSLSSSGSVEGWFFCEAGTTVMRDNTSASTAGWIVAYDKSGSLAYRVAGKSFVTTIPTASLRGGWHHIAVTKNGGSVALYLDGRLVHSGTGAGATAAALPWHVMRNGTYAQFAQGRADELAIYSTALPGSTVANHYTVGRTP